MAGTTTCGSRLPSWPTHIAAITDLPCSEIPVTPMFQDKSCAAASGLALLLGISIVGTTGVNPRWRRPAAAGARIWRGRTGAHAGFRQYQFDAFGGLAIAGDVGRN